jgi:DNA-binding MarR family transcriptional regulator
LLRDVVNWKAGPLKEPATKTHTHTNIDFDAPIPSLIAILANILTRSISRYCRQTFNIGSIDQRILMLLRRQPELSASKIAGLTDLDKAAVSRSLAVLGEERLVDIVPIRPGARMKLLRLTQKGKTVSEEIGRRSAERYETTFACVPQHERDRFRSVLRMLITANLELDGEAQGRLQKGRTKVAALRGFKAGHKRTALQSRPRKSRRQARP